MTREEAIAELSVLHERLSNPKDYEDGCYSWEDGWYVEAIDMAIEALSEEPPYQYSKAYVEQIRGERDILQDMVDNMAKPKTEMVLCVLADRVCPFQGREFALCLTCPHISEEDRALVKKAVAEPKTGWIPVSERLPSEDGCYLVCMTWEYNKMDVLTWADGWNCYRDYYGKIRKESEIDGANILAWMPLPDPYKGGAKMKGADDE